MKLKYSKHNIQSLRKMIWKFFCYLNVKTFSCIKAKDSFNYKISH